MGGSFPLPLPSIFFVPRSLSPTFLLSFSSSLLVQMEVEEWRGSLWARAAAEALAALDSSSTSVPADMGAALQSTFREGRLAAFRFAPGFVPLLSRLRSSGRRTAIITNGHARVQREKVEACGAAKEVDVVLVGGEEIERGCGHEKPHPSIFEKACGLLGVDAGACAMVGDSYKADVQGARNAGLALAVWVNPSGAAAPGDVHDAEVGDALDVEEVVERYERGESPALPLVSPELLPPEAEALVFDLDGTVLDTMGHHWLAWKETAHRYGLVMTQRMLSQVAGMPTREIFAKLAREQGKEGTFDIPTATKEKTQAYLRHSGETGTIRPVMRILRQARKQGLKVAAATGGNRAQITLSLAQSGLWRPGDHTYFDAVITSDEVTHGKPHPETFLMAAEALGVEPAKCVGYEDAPYGMQAIKAAGFLKAIDVTKIPGYPQPEDD